MGTPGTPSAPSWNNSPRTPSTGADGARVPAPGKCWRLLTSALRLMLPGPLPERGGGEDCSEWLGWCLDPAGETRCCPGVPTIPWQAAQSCSTAPALAGDLPWGPWGPSFLQPWGRGLLHPVGFFAPSHRLPSAPAPASTHSPGTRLFCSRRARSRPFAKGGILFVGIISSTSV